MSNEIETILKEALDRIIINPGYETAWFNKDRTELINGNRVDGFVGEVSSSLKALLESLVEDLEGEKKKGKYLAKYCSQCGEEIGYDRANKEYFCGTCPFRSSENKEDLTQSQGDWNLALNLAQERIRAKLK